MKKVLTILAFAASATFANPISGISGRVTDSLGAGLAGAVVRLANANTETETDRNGNYVLPYIPTGISNNSPGSVSIGSLVKPMVSAGVVRFSVGGENSMVRLAIYDLRGKFVTEMLCARLNAGNYSFRLQGNLSAQSYILKVSINGTSHALRFSIVNKRSFTPGFSGAVGGLDRLEKVSAASDTIKVTKPGYEIAKKAADTWTGSSSKCDFRLGRWSSWNGDTAAFWGDTNGYPKEGTTIVILNRTNGAFPNSKIFWSNQINGTKIQLSQQSQFKLPPGSGRFFLWIAPNDSNNRYYDYIEYVSSGAGTGGVFYSDISRVDGWRLPIAMRIHTADGKNTTVGDSYEMFFQSRLSKFLEYVNEVPKEFSGLAMQDFANIYSPSTSPVNCFGTGGAYENYFKNYLVQARSVNAALPQSAIPASDVFGCMGAWSNPAFSAAMNRHVAHLPSGTNYAGWKNSAQYYTAGPCNYYSKWSHRHSIADKSYGFPYDDWNDQSSFVQTQNTTWVAIAIGW
jgi:hypothetical protein